MSAQTLMEIKKQKKLNKYIDKIQKQSRIKVICRIKPLNLNQQGIDIKIDKDNSQITIVQPRKDTIKTFTFNQIYTNQTQSKFVSQVCRQILNKNSINNKGYLIFSYGVTNSGKTHTILGSQTQLGILPYLVNQFSKYQQVYLSAIQLYNDEFYSLQTKQKLIPKQINGFLDFSHYNILKRITKQNINKIFIQYYINRTQNQTKNNNKSSRSHAIFKIKINQIIIGVIDLAGSQRTNRVFATIDQTTNINKSLLCLGKCIKALKQNPQSQQLIPYRQSKLTKVLIQYFINKVDVTMIVNINQSQSCFHQNMKVLDYAVLAKDIQHYSIENSYKKNQYKSIAKSADKIDIYETLYKSSKKQLSVSKRIKKQKNNDKQNNKQLTDNKNNDKSNYKQLNDNKKFAKILKIKQLQLYIQKFNSSQQTFQFMIDYMHQQQLQQDQRIIKNINILQYQSPYLKTNPNYIKSSNDVGVGRGDLSIELMRQQIAINMKQQLKKRLQQQRLHKMQNKQTQIGNSLNKQQFPQATPDKAKKSLAQSSLIIKTSSIIVSSIKKMLHKNVQSVKKILPVFMKNNQDNFKKLTLCNYGQQFQTLFQIQNPHQLSSSPYLQQSQNVCYSLQNNVSQLTNNRTNEQIQPLNFNYIHQQIKQISTKSNSQNSINQPCQYKPKIPKINKQILLIRKNKLNQFLYRQMKRTPLKKRLRNYAQH